MGTTIPEHLRDSILRLVEAQGEEEREKAAALRGYHGYYQDDEDGDDDGSHEEGGENRKVKLRADGEESGEEEVGDKVVVSHLSPNPKA